MLENIPTTILDDMDNLLATRDNDSTGKRMGAICEFLDKASKHFIEQRQSTADQSRRHDLHILSLGFNAGKLIAEHARTHASAQQTGK